ncbi:MAG: nitroreductase family protein [Clostridia bacterium]
MNEVINNILTRRSVRSFSDTPISKADMETLIKAGLYAPSGMGRQTWKFTGILNASIIAELADTISKVLDRQNYNFYNAKSLILISNAKDSAWGRDDNACALQNIMLAANSMEIGSVWINQLKGICDHEEIRPILTKLGIPANHEIYGLAALGYSTNPPAGIVDKIGEFVIID